MIVTETVIVTLDKLDKTKNASLRVNADTLPVYGRIFVHEGFKILKIEHNHNGVVKLYTVENMNRPQVSYDVKIVPTGYKIEPLDEYIDTIKMFHPESPILRRIGDPDVGHLFLQHSHPPKEEKID